MSSLKRIIIVLYALIAAASLWWFSMGIALPLPGFLDPQLVNLAAYGAWCISMAGFVILLLIGLLSPRRHQTVRVATVEGGSILVAHDAIASAVRHMAEASGNVSCKRIKVKQSRGAIHVKLEVVPHAQVSVAQVGPQMTQYIIEGLSSVIGTIPRAVDVEFTRYTANQDASDQLEDEQLDADSTAPEHALNTTSQAVSSSQRPDSTGDIRVQLSPKPTQGLED